LHLLQDVLGWRICDVPRLRPRRLMRPGEHLEMRPEEFSSIPSTQSAIGVNGYVIPRRNDSPGFLFRWVPCRRDVRVRSGEDDERLAWLIRAQTRVRIGARHMAEQCRHWSSRAIEDEWEVRCKEPFGGRTRHQCGERMCVDECEERRKVTLRERAWDVHGDYRASRTSRNAI